MTVYTACSDCNRGWQRCHVCQGKGEVNCPYAAPCGPGHAHPCSICRAKGELPCRSCRGRGEVERQIESAG